MTRRLDGDFLVLLALRRVRRGGLTLRGEQFCDRGQLMPPSLLVDTLSVLLDQGQVAAADPDPQSGPAPLRLTAAGASSYAELAAQQWAALPVPPPEHPTQTLAGHRLGSMPSGPGAQPDPAA